MRKGLRRRAAKHLTASHTACKVTARMTVGLLCVALAAVPCADGDVLHVQAKTAWGLAELNGQFLVTDIGSASLLLLHTDGSVISRLQTGPSEKASRPRGLCVVGDQLAYADELTLRIVYVDPSDMSVRGEIAAPGPQPMGLAFDGSALWCADHKEKRLYRLDPRTGRVFGHLPSPGHAPHAMAWSEGKLWVQDDWDNCAYRVDPTTGVIELSVALPGGTCRGILPRPGALLVVMTAKNDIVEVAYQENGGCAMSLPIDAHVRLEWPISARAKQGAPAGARAVVAVPPDTPRQTITNLRFFPEGVEVVTDEYGQQYAEWAVPPLEHGKPMTFGWEADVRVRFVRYAFVPPDHDTAAPSEPEYLASDRFITVGAPAIRELGAGLEHLHPVTALLALRDRIHERLVYKLEGGWDAADKTLARGNGSCSEYSFVLVSAARAMGIPMRLAGGTALNGAKGPADPGGERPDRIFHRWTEAHVPGWGWVPIDANRDDKRPIPPFRRLHFLALPNRVLVCSRTPLCERARLGTHYLVRLERPQGPNHWGGGPQVLWTVTEHRPWSG